MNSEGADFRWVKHIEAAYRHALVRYEIARQDLAVAMVEKDSEAALAAQQLFGEWQERHVQLGKLLRGMVFTSRGAGK